ncbi:hypothetical protein AO080_04265 [Weissella cibaria]|nr:hypothetical protein AO080_04265 [Weissella cibaria]
MYQKYIKTIIDVLFASLLTVALLPLLALIAVSVKLTSSGPVLFKQLRYGKNSEQFWIYKFRTMQIDAPILADQDFYNKDKYLTPIGKFLRSTSLDELPQLINILDGDMSFIGPRPLSDTDIEVISARLENGADLIKPGITGYAQVNGRNTIDNEQKAYLDSVYAENISLEFDVWIIFQTVFKVLSRKDINLN